MPQTQILPDQASTMAPQVDALYFFLIALTAFFTLLISGMVVYFAIKYRRRGANDAGVPIHGNMRLEAIWTVIPLLIVLFIFGWSASLFFTMARPPAQTLDVYVVGKQWMWKFQHADGRAEVNELHVPIGHNIRLTMTSQDVIHDVYIPDFRVKADVLPGRYTHLWFKATKPGRYHLFCAEYCGTNHSGMVGWVVVQERAEYQQWLAGGTGQGTMAQTGEKLFKDLSCITCHKDDTTGRGPTLLGLYGKAVTLDNGNAVEADEAYIRESVVNPRAKIVSGFQPIMPTFQGLISEEGLLQLIEYVKSLKATPSNATGVPAAAPAAPGTPAKK
ncbi:MAG: cytochrome c oxidase subunit II [Acidobacteria bacterium]|nr:cytochrome c oxidase subunit II [Acidobacteriota bacterium]